MEIIPSSVWFTTNRSCNNKCNWCYAQNFKCSHLEMDFDV